jgi:hypothetical protein
MSETKKSLTTSLAIDIDLRCRPGLDELLGYFGSSVAILRRTGDDASIELKASHTSLDEELLNVAALVQAFPVEGKKLWHQCELRRINFWIHVRKEPREGSYEISSETVTRLAALQFEIVFTVHAPVDTLPDQVVASFTSPDGQERVLIVQRPDNTYSYRHQRLSATNSVSPEDWRQPGPYCGIYDSQHTAEQEAFHRVPWLANRKPH